MRWNLGVSEWEQLIENSIDAMLLCDGSGNVLIANQMAADNINIAKSDLVGNNIYKLVKEGVYKQSTIAKCLESRHVVTDVVLREDDMPLLSTSQPIFDDKGNVAFVVTNSRTTKLLEDLQTKITAIESEQKQFAGMVLYLNEKSGERIIAESPQMKEIIQYCDSVSNYDGSLLINGESGCGKDIIARYIHAKSRRHDKPYLPVNCSAIPRELFESEFFGYEKGAFTGAKSGGKMGIFEIVNNGTIFLDEIGDLPLEMQPKLLRVLESGEYSPIGSGIVKKTNIRLISATNRNLRDMMKEGTFREDLYYRLSVVPISIPPLRERHEDIIALCEAFLAQENKKYNKHKYLSKSSINVMLNYSWPGNIRELKNVIERAFVISRGDELNVKLDEFAGEMVELSSKGGGLLNKYGRFKTLDKMTEEFRSEIINEALQESDGNVKEVSDNLGLHRSTVYRYMNK